MFPSRPATMHLHLSAATVGCDDIGTRTRTRVRRAALLAALLAAGSSTGAALADHPVSPASSTVQATTTLAPPQAQQTIMAALTRLTGEQRARYRIGIPFAHPLFPDDAALTMPPPARDLLNWLALPPAQRRDDLLISPDIDYFWHAEGRPFSCRFLVHFERAGGLTRFQVIQIEAVQRYPKTFHLLGRTGPGWYTDVRPTAPSAQAEADLLAWLSTALSGALTPAQPQ